MFCLSLERCLVFEYQRKGSASKALARRGYTIRECIGGGQYGKVYIADYMDGRDSQHSQKLACKFVDTQTATREFVRKFFPRELEIISRVNYKFCIRVHSVIQYEKYYFVFMQYCPNGDLIDFMRVNGAIREGQARVWFSQLLKAINYLTSLSIAHRDIKPDNILLTAAYNIKLTDFGFARFMHPLEKLSSTFCGSLPFAAPEILRGKPYDPIKSDIWSAGIVLYTMINRGLPFNDTSIPKMYEAQIKRNWKFRNGVLPLVTKELKDFMFRILDPEPTSRPSAIDLWKLPWIQTLTYSGQQVTPPPSPTPSIMERNRLYWEEEERKLLLTQPQPATNPELVQEPENTSEQQHYTQLNSHTSELIHGNFLRETVPGNLNLAGETESTSPKTVQRQLGTTNLNVGVQKPRRSPR